jgi:hypothetical protein
MIAVLLAMQAVAVDSPPLEAGRWILRRTVERGTGAPGLSAALRADDGSAQLLVRCDIGYRRTLSIQFLPGPHRGISLAVPVTLNRVTSTETSIVPLIWEPGPNGAFARDGEEDGSASDAAADLIRHPGRLSVISADRGGNRIETSFQNRQGREVIGQIIAACPWQAGPDEPKQDHQ